MDLFEKELRKDKNKEILNVGDSLLDDVFPNFYEFRNNREKENIRIEMI